MENQIEIFTERLLLRSLTPSIIHHLFNTQTKEEIMTYLGLDESGFEHYKAMHEKGMETNRLSLFIFQLIDKETNIPIGECGFHTWNRTHNRTELFYHINQPNFKEKGLMSEALKRVIEFGFTESNLHRIEALLDANNTPSLKLLQKNNFTKEGTMREDYVVNGVNSDSECYSLLKWEWKNSLL